MEDGAGEGGEVIPLVVGRHNDEGLVGHGRRRAYRQIPPAAKRPVLGDSPARSPSIFGRLLPIRKLEATMRTVLGLFLAATVLWSFSGCAIPAAPRLATGVAYDDIDSAPPGFEETGVMRSLRG